MNRNDWRQLAQLRLDEAKILLDNGIYPGAYYLAGYVVECALKACIARQVQQYDFPDKDLAQRSFTHKLTELIDVAGLRVSLTSSLDASSVFAANWNIVKDWRETARYEHEVPETSARALYIAIIEPNDGVLPWLKAYW